MRDWARRGPPLDAPERGHRRTAGFRGIGDIVAARWRPERCGHRYSHHSPTAGRAAFVLPRRLAVNAGPAPVSGAVEGIVDEAVIRTLLAHAGREAGTIYVQGGKAKLLRKARGVQCGGALQPVGRCRRSERRRGVCAGFRQPYDPGAIPADDLPSRRSAGRGMADGRPRELGALPARQPSTRAERSGGGGRCQADDGEYRTGLERQARETGHGADTGRRPQDRAELRRKTHRIRDAALAT